MKSSIKVERWEFPIFKAEPSGFEYIEVSLTEPSCSIDVKAIISLQAAIEFGERLIKLCNSLKAA